SQYQLELERDPFGDGQNARRQPGADGSRDRRRRRRRVLQGDRENRGIARAAASLYRQGDHRRRGCAGPGLVPAGGERYDGIRAGLAHRHHHGERARLYQRAQQARVSPPLPADGRAAGAVNILTCESSWKNREGELNHKIAVFPGDGIGPEVVREGTELLSRVAKLYDFNVEYEQGLVGGASIDAHGKPLTDPVLKLAKQSDAVLLGAMGGPKWDSLDYSIRPERALLALRQELGLFANLRPVKLFSALASASTLKREVVEGTDLLVVRELTGGIYFGQPKGVTKLPDGTERGVNTEVYTTPEIERIAKVGFEAARRRRNKVTSVDKANVLEATELWRKVVTRVHKDSGYADVALDHMLVDNCA